MTGRPKGSITRNGKRVKCPECPELEPLWLTGWPGHWKLVHGDKPRPKPIPVATPVVAPELFPPNSRNSKSEAWRIVRPRRYGALPQLEKTMPKQPKRVDEEEVEEQIEAQSPGKGKPRAAAAPAKEAPGSDEGDDLDAFLEGS